MKTRALLILSIFLLSACSKSDSTSNNNNIEKKIQGSWKIESWKTIYYDAKNKNVYELDNLTMNTTWKLDNGKFTSSIDGDTLFATYSINGKILTVTQEHETDNLDIIALTDSAMDISETDSAENKFDTPPVISTYNVLTYHFKKL